MLATESIESMITIVIFQPEENYPIKFQYEPTTGWGSVVFNDGQTIAPYSKLDSLDDFLDYIEVRIHKEIRPIEWAGLRDVIESRVAEGQSVFEIGEDKRIK